jgi:hypothetical protein
LRAQKFARRCEQRQQRNFWFGYATHLELARSNFPEAGSEADFSSFRSIDKSNAEQPQ